jgi:hypothetical protein
MYHQSTTYTSYFEQPQQPLYTLKPTCLFSNSSNDMMFPVNDTNMMIKKEEQDFYPIGGEQDLLLTSGYYPNHNSILIEKSTTCAAYPTSSSDEYSASNLSSPDMMAYQYYGAGESCDMSFLSSPSHYSNASYSPVESLSNFDFYPTVVNNSTAFMQQQGYDCGDSTIFNSTTTGSSTTGSSCNSSICDNDWASTSPLVLAYTSMDNNDSYFTSNSSLAATPITTPAPAVLLPPSSTSSTLSSSSSSISSKTTKSTTSARPVTATESRPYPCHLCRRAFARKHDLQRHVRVHTGDKPYVCPCCKKAFARTDALKRHLRMEDNCRSSQEVQAMKDTGRRRYRNL